MKVKDIKAYCLNKWKTYEDYPFGDIPICYKLNGKVFAQIYPKQEDFKITLKCTADAGQFYRQVYPGVVVRGYHCPPVQQPYWNTIYPEDFPDEELLNMIDHAYDTVLHSFSKKIQRQILTADEIEIRLIKPKEYPLLKEFLYDAIYLPEGAAVPPREIVNQPELAVYITDFGQPDDLCMVAEACGHILGAAWTRILAGKVKGYVNVDDHTPEFAISVKKEFRRQGIGSKLMQEMIVLLKNKGYEKVSLSVNKGGTMGVGKTAACQILKNKLPNCAFLTGTGLYEELDTEKIDVSHITSEQATERIINRERGETDAEETV